MPEPVYPASAMQNVTFGAPVTVPVPVVDVIHVIMTGVIGNVKQHSHVHPAAAEGLEMHDHIVIDSVEIVVHIAVRGVGVDVPVVVRTTAPAVDMDYTS